MNISIGKSSMKLLILSFVFFTCATGFAASQVVVIPLGGDSVNKGLVPVAVGSIDSLGGISSAFGVSSVLNSEVGTYVITLSGEIDSGNPIVMLTPFTTGFPGPEIMGYEAIDSNSFRIRVQDAAGDAKDSAFSFAVYNVE